jgi:cobyrinic acid a,c-diamide synthase
VRIEIPRLVIAAPSSGSGKSTVATGLMAALRRLPGSAAVQGFKVGPDYIDPGYHSVATDRPARNLDTWMVPVRRVLESFGRAAAGADVAVVEGVMGLFDGYSGSDDAGSTAEVAKILRAPVILVIDVRKMARSAAAVALGCARFDRALNVAGVICNNVGSPRHAAWVAEAIEAVGLPVLGCLPRQPELAVPERHLGLHTAIERQDEARAFIDNAARLVARHIDVPGVLRIARQAPPLDLPDTSEAWRRDPAAPPTGVRIAVAYDEAFCFYYTDNFDLLRAAGAEMAFFSPLASDRLPAGCSGLYLGGGYPELYADRLTANDRLWQSVRAAARAGMPIYAECGGLMVLSTALVDQTGQEYLMAGVLPGRARMLGRLTMGYRIVTARHDSILLARGEQVRGHEFHYSDWVERPDALPAAYDVVRHVGEDPTPEGFVRGNLLASYIHLHFASRPDMAERWVAACQAWQQSHPRGGSSQDEA